MSIIGTYSNKALNATLEIKEANNSNGQGSGTFTIAGVAYEVSVRYHFDNNVGPTTVMQIYTANTYGWDFVGMSGSTPTTDGSGGITLAGGVSSTKETSGFSGLFTK
ncbi:hypothetical protein [Kordia sp.]|uniref:hypothetical protein n=1 Tax=Kordia sp. TaxID=1965332 RepID=UPI003B597AF5